MILEVVTIGFGTWKVLEVCVPPTFQMYVTPTLHIQAGPVEGKLHWSGLLVLEPKFVGQHIELSQGVQGHAPPRTFFWKFDALRWFLRLFWAYNIILKSLLQSWHGNRILIHFTSTCMAIGVHRHQRFQAHLENHVKKHHTKASQSSASHLVEILF